MDAHYANQYALPPATVGEWMLRVTALLSNHGANPIP